MKGGNQNQDQSTKTETRPPKRGSSKPIPKHKSCWTTLNRVKYADAGDLPRGRNETLCATPLRERSLLLPSYKPIKLSRCVASRRFEQR
jgi:hypothetical protein